jgi:hypothetical protein
MAVMEPNSNSDNNNNNEEKKYYGEAYRKEIISELPLSLQFHIRRLFTEADKYSRESAIEALKDCIVLNYHKDKVTKELLKAS